jgi:P4 family phage/plasmid primase-like protien
MTHTPIAKHACASDVITVIRDTRKPLGKVFSLSPDGSVQKTVSAKVGVVDAVMRHVPDHDAMADLLRELSNDPHAALINAGFNGVEIDEDFVLMPEAGIAKLVDSNDRKATAGVHTCVKYADNKVLGRFKENVYPSTWQLFDRDIDEHTPAKFGLEQMDFEAWLTALSHIFPGADAASYVRADSSSARIVGPDGRRGSAGNGHVWVQVEDTADVNRVGRIAILSRAIELGLVWNKPRFSRKEPGVVIGQSLTTLVDPSVWTPGRIVFVGQPTVGPEFRLEPQHIVVGGLGEIAAIDTSMAECSRDDATRAYKKMGIAAEVSLKTGGVSVTLHDLRLETELELKDGSTITVEEAIAAGKKQRCQTPFRASTSLAAFFNLDANGEAFVHDVGTGETHRLNHHTQAALGFTECLADVQDIGQPAAVPPAVVPPMRERALVDMLLRSTGNGGDVKNGQLFAAVWQGRLLHIHETSDWLQFDAQAGWVSAPPGEEDRAAKAVLAKMRDFAAEQYKTAPDDAKTKRLMAHVDRTSKAPNLRAMIDMAKSEKDMTARLSEFDTDPMLLGTVNGVLDLRTGQLKPVSPDLLVSKRCTVTFVPDADCPRFKRFMADVQPDVDMCVFLQRWAGYCLTGSVNEQKFIFLYGGGANGKSVFIELLAWLLGDYSRKIATEMLMQHQRSPQGPSPDIVALKGVRLAYANETEEGRRLAEARVKEMTGGDSLTGRVPYGKADITFQPSQKLVIVGNHRPEITDNSYGMWRRVALTPFDVTIPEDQRDPRLLEALKEEGPGILNWALEGLRQWQTGGLAVPTKIEAATAAYRDEQDVIGEWIADQCTTGAGYTARKDQLYEAYRSWALKNGHQPMAQKRLTRRLNERGFKPLPDKRTISGLALHRPDELMTEIV